MFSNLAIRFPVVFIVVFLVIGHLRAQTNYRPIIAVMPLKQSGFEESDIDYIVNLISTVFVNSKKYKVLERWQIETILDEQKINLSGCVDDACAIEVGKLLSAHMVVTGYLYNKAKRNYYDVYGALKLINVTTSEIIRIVDIKIQGDYSKLIDHIKNKTYILANEKKPVFKYITKFIFKFTAYGALGAMAYYGYQFGNNYKKYKKATDKYDMLNQKKKAKNNYEYLKYSGLAFGTSVFLNWLSNQIFSDHTFIVFNYQKNFGSSQISVAFNF